MNKTFIFQKVFGSYEVVIWIVVADSMEFAFRAMQNYFHNQYEHYDKKTYDFNYSHSIENLTPIPPQSLINGINYDPKTDLSKFDPTRTYLSASGTYYRTNKEGWWDVKEFYSDLPKGYILLEAHDG